MGTRAEPHSEGPGARVVLLGASNLSRGFATVVRLARGRLAAPLEVLAAPGRGRSYGTEASFLGRVLPGIEGCGLWSALERSTRDLPTRALVCDVGNDVAFGVPGPVILQWLERVLDRLADRGARITVLGPPVESVRGISPRAFEFWSRLFFPGRAARREPLIATLEEVDAGLRRTCEARGLEFVAPRLAWYGLDPIHVRHGSQLEAWGTVLESWGEATAWRGRVPCPPPLERRILGVPFRTDQPAARLPDGSTIAIY